MGELVGDEHSGRPRPSTRPHRTPLLEEVEAGVDAVCEVKLCGGGVVFGGSLLAEEDESEGAEDAEDESAGVEVGCEADGGAGVEVQASRPRKPHPNEDVGEADVAEADVVEVLPDAVADSATVGSVTVDVPDEVGVETGGGGARSGKPTSASGRISRKRRSGATR